MFNVKVPGTSANIGPGFDTLGMALNLYNSFTFEEIEKGLEILGGEERYRNSNNLVYTSIVKTFEKIGYKPKGIKINMDTDIPISRGLGSSATCIVAGVIGASKLAGDTLSKEDILNIATEIEGHPDNIVPALYGGLTTSIIDKGKVVFNKINISKGLKFIAIIPDFKLTTREARNVLPKKIDYKDGVYNISRVAILISALSNGNFDLIKYGIQDMLHQPYRGDLIPYFNNIINKSNELDAFGTYLSGAGPTIIGIIDINNNKFIKSMEDYLKSLNLNWDLIELKLDLEGAIINSL